MAKRGILLAAVAALAAAGGCKTYRTCDSDGGMEISQREGAEAEIVSTDVCFGEGLRIERTSFVRNALGFPVFTVVAGNLHGDPDDFDRKDAFAFQYRFSWFDKDGNEVSPASGIWRETELGGGATAPLSATAPGSEAVQAILRLRHAR